jgi:hypothetical protein
MNTENSKIDDTFESGYGSNPAPAIKMRRLLCYNIVPHSFNSFSNCLIRKESILTYICNISYNLCTVQYTAGGNAVGPYTDHLF